MHPNRWQPYQLPPLQMHTCAWRCTISVVDEGLRRGEAQRQQSGGFNAGNQTWISALVQPSASCVALGKLMNFSGVFSVIASDPLPGASVRSLKSQGPVGADFNRGEEV